MPSNRRHHVYKFFVNNPDKERSSLMRHVETPRMGESNKLCPAEDTHTEPATYYQPAARAAAKSEL
jgi:hypothetical protein